MFPVRKYRDELKNKEWIVGIHIGELSAAFPLRELMETGQVKARVGEALIRVRYNADLGTVEALDESTGETLPTTRAYWFAWQAFYPETALWRAP